MNLRIYPEEVFKCVFVYGLFNNKIVGHYCK